MAGVTDANGFRQAWWLPGPHLQTSWGRLARPRSAVPLVRQVLETPDDDDLVLDHLEAPPGASRLVILHGLEGSSNSVYVQGLLELARRRGLAATALNFRTCARDPDDLSRMLPNRTPRFYHSGETSDLDHVLKTLALREPGVLLGAIGASLGGNVLLKWLGENPDSPLLAAAATLSVPYDLGAGSRFMETFAGLLYVDVFLKTLRGKVFESARRFPEAASRLDLERVRRARTFFEFDDAATAPLHGFAGAQDYYTRSSSLGFLPAIRVETLALSAEDDPFLPREALERARAAASSAVSLVVTKGGGHVGWVAANGFSTPFYWAEEKALAFVADRLTARSRHSDDRARHEAR